MKQTGMTRKIDELGRVVLPIEIRRTMEAKTGDLLEIYVQDGAIILKKVENSCAFCSAHKDLVEFHGHWVCGKCLSELKNLL